MDRPQNWHQNFVTVSCDIATNYGNQRKRVRPIFEKTLIKNAHIIGMRTKRTGAGKRCGRWRRLVVFSDRGDQFCLLLSF